MFEELMNAIQTDPAKPATPPAGEAPKEDAPITVTATKDSAPPAPEVTPFGETPGVVDRQAANLKTAAQGAVDVLAAATLGLKAAQETREGILADANARRGALLQDTVAVSSGIHERLKPLFAKRAAIDERQRQIAEMNPIKRGIMGLVNRNYDEGYLGKEEALLDDEISGLSQEFSVLNAVNDKVISGVTDQYSDQDREQVLKSAGLSQEIQLSTWSYQTARQSLDATITGLEAKSSVLRAQGLMRDEALATLDAGGINAAIAAAQKNGGKAIVNGAEIPLASLQQRGKQLAMQDMALAEQKNNLTASNMRLDATRESFMVSNMNYNDVKSALSNNGMFRGVQLDLAQLGQRGAQLTETLDVAANMNSGASMAQYTKQVWGQVGTMHRVLMNKDAEMNGGSFSPAMKRYLVGEAARIERYNQGLAAVGNDPNVRQRYIAAGLKEAQQSFAEADALITGIATSMTTDKDAQIAIKSYYTGQPLTQEQSVKAISAFTRSGSLPPGIKLAGPAGAAFTAAGAAVARLEQSEAYKGATKDEQNQMRNRIISEVVGGQFNNYHSQAITNKVPGYAREDKHPFGSMLSDDQFRTGIAAGDEMAYSRWGAAHGGLNAAQVKALFSDKKQQDLYNSQRQQNPVNFVSEGNQLVADQQVAVMQQFESMHPGAAAAFADYIRSPRFQSRMGLYADSAGVGDLPTQLASAAGGNSLRDRLSAAMNGYPQAALTAKKQTALDHVALYSGYGNDPFLRASAVVAANPDLTPAEEKALMTAVRKMVGPAPNTGMSASDFMNQEAQGNEANFLAISSLIKNQKFQDPGLERIRKIAAKSWDSDLASADRVIRSQKGQ